VTCTNCGTENRAGRRFCSNCGNALAAACPNCGAENEPNDRFCGNCGRSLPGAPAATAGQATAVVAPSAAAQSATERRLVTVMFADLVGFTPFAEERDAEEVRDTLEHYGAIAREVVGRYGGTVEKFIGDAVMAVWGTPIAHEDDAERAVRAALELTDAVRGLGPAIQARAGVLTGEAAVNLGATDQNLLAGDLVNTAARLQSVAPPGSVLVGESTMRATSASVAYDEAGEQALKGKQAPVPAWRALRIVAQRRGAKRTEALETPFVGRDEEFRLLREQLHLTGRDPRVRLVSITGPAGIGKSRLAWELEKYIDGVVDTIYWHRGRCPAYGEGVSFWALGEMVRRRAGLAETDSEATTRERLHAAVEEYVSEASERDWIEAALLALLGVGDNPDTGRETLFAAWRRFFENVAAHGTTVLVFEDLHWADQGLLDFIDHLLDWSKQAPLLVVTLARPELFDRRPDWGAGRRTFTALALDPLSETAMSEMLQALVPDLPAAALAAIVARADGIPLYAVETVRMLLADGRLEEHDGHYQPSGELGTLEVPNSLRSLITSRLDGLDADDRRVVQDAAVLGQSFTLAALADLTGDDVAGLESRLRRLVRREVLELEQDPRSPERGQFGFTQSLVREVAYSTLTRPQRRERHLAAARYLEAGGGDELAGVLAGHYLAAFEASAAGAEADAVGAQARVALRGAAERAAELGGHRQAADFLGQALKVTSAPAERALLLERQALELNLTGRHDDAIDSARAAVELYRQLSDSAGIARARTLLGHIYVWSNRETDGLAELQAALAELPADIEPALRADTLAKLARAQYRANEWQAAIVTADEALAIAERHRLLAILADAMTSKGTALSIGTRIIEAMTLLRGGYELARRVGDSPTELRAAANLMLVATGEDGPREGLRLTIDALEAARRVGDFPQFVWLIGNAVYATAFAGESLAERLAAVDELLAGNISAGDRATLLRAQSFGAGLAGEDIEPILAEYARLVAGGSQTSIEFQRFAAALGRADYAAAAKIAQAANDERPELGLAGHAVLAAVMDRDLAEARRLLPLMEEAPIIGRIDETVRTIARAAVAVLAGHAAEATPSLRGAMSVLEETGDGFDYAYGALAILRAGGPENPDAREAAARALAIFERVGALKLVDEVRAALAGAGTQTGPDRPPAAPAATETAAATSG
jgi:class 3 adenylate cyclase/tetratricopeptide (TPR) repeat protein